MWNKSDEPKLNHILIVYFTKSVITRKTTQVKSRMIIHGWVMKDVTSSVSFTGPPKYWSRRTSGKQTIQSMFYLKAATHS